MEKTLKSRTISFGLCFLALLFMAAFTPLFGQTAVKLEVLLNEKAVTWSQAADFVLEASDSFKPSPDQQAGISAADDSQKAAYNFAADKKWLPKKAVPDGAVKLNGISVLLMQSFDLKGGLFFRISKSPHHAFRELVYRGVISGEADPDTVVSGQQLLLMVSKILAITEGKEAQK